MEFMRKSSVRFAVCIFLRGVEVGYQSTHQTLGLEMSGGIGTQAALSAELADARQELKLWPTLG